MTDTKHTPGHETGLTPRQLAQQRDELLAACEAGLAALEAQMLAEDPAACTQIEWEAEPMASMRTAIARATGQ